MPPTFSSDFLGKIVLLGKSVSNFFVFSFFFSNSIVLKSARKTTSIPAFLVPTLKYFVIPRPNVYHGGRIFDIAMNSIYTSPLETRLASIESGESQLSNDAKIIKNGSILTYFMSIFRKTHF